MELEMWELGAQSYRSYCSFEMDSFEAWNNLAKCYIKLDMKERAWRVLQEALRCDYDGWSIWNNLMVIATDIITGHLKIENEGDINQLDRLLKTFPWSQSLTKEVQKVLAE